MIAARCLGTSLLMLLLIAASVAAADADADQLGRLFTTPEQRARIDSLRYAIETELPKVEPEVTSQPAEPKEIIPLAPVHLRGLISSADGNLVYWINDSSNLQADFLQNSITVLPGTATNKGVSIKLPDESIVPLQVGESYIPKVDANQSDSRAETRAH